MKLTGCLYEIEYKTPVYATALSNDGNRHGDLAEGDLCVVVERTYILIGIRDGGTLRLGDGVIITRITPSGTWCDCLTKNGHGQLETRSLKRY
jgi:hypothetical protein